MKRRLFISGIILILVIICCSSQLYCSQSGQIKGLFRKFKEMKNSDNMIDFEKIPLLGKLKKFYNHPIRIKSPRIEVDKKNKNFIYVTGRADILGLVHAPVILTLSAGVDHTGKFEISMTFAITLPEKGWKIFDYYTHIGSHSGLAGNSFEPLHLDGGAIVISNDEQWQHSKTMPRDVRRFYKPVWSDGNFIMKLEPGMNVFGRLDFKHCLPIRDLLKIFHEENISLFVQGVLGLRVRDLMLHAILDCPLSPKIFPKFLTAVSPGIKLTGKPEVGCTLDVVAKMPPKNDKIKFSIEIIAPTNARVSEKGITRKLKVVGGIGGKWHNAFGIKGFILDEFVLEGEIDVEKEEPDFGFAAKFEIGSRKIRIAAKVPLPFPEDMSEVAFQAKINKLTLKDIVDYTFFLQREAAMAVGLPVDKIEKILHLKEIELKPVVMSFAAMPDLHLGIKQGITASGRFFVFGKDLCDIDLHINLKDGIIGKARINPIKLGPFTVKGRGKDKGPRLDLAVTTSDTRLHLSGEIDFFKSTGVGILFNLGRKINAEFEVKLFGDDLDIKLEGPPDVLKNPMHGQFAIRAIFREKILNHLEDLISAHVKAAGKSIDDGLSRAQQTLQHWQKKVNSLDDQIHQREVYVRRNRNNMIRKIDDAENRVNSLQGIINQRFNERNHLPWWKKIFEWPVLTVEIGGLEAAKAVADGVLEVIKRVTKIIPIDADPVIIGLKFLRATAGALIVAAEKVLKMSKTVCDTFAHVLEDILSFHIEVIEIDASRLTAGMLIGKSALPPDLGIKVLAKYRGKPHMVNFNFDFGHPIASSFSLGKAIFVSKPANVGLSYYRLKGNHASFVSLDSSGIDYYNREKKEMDYYKKYNKLPPKHPVPMKELIKNGLFRPHVECAEYRPPAGLKKEKARHRTEEYHKHLLGLKTKEDF